MLVPTNFFFPGGDKSRKELKQSLYKNKKNSFLFFPEFSNNADPCKRSFDSRD
jgi:hypothetical protein